MEDRTEHKRPDEGDKSSVQEWLIPIGLGVFFFLWGLFIYYAVGTKGPPPWGFGNIEDIPGESAYSTHEIPLRTGSSKGPPPAQPVQPQHVMEPPKTPEKAQ